MIERVKEWDRDHVGAHGLTVTKLPQTKMEGALGTTLQPLEITCELLRQVLSWRLLISRLRTRTPITVAKYTGSECVIRSPLARRTSGNRRKYSRSEVEVPI